MDLDYDRLFKVLLVGDAGAGKTTLLRRLTGYRPDGAQLSTIGVDFAIHTFTTPDGAVVKLQIWDTAGQERFRAITQSYYRGAHVVLLVYDAADPDGLTGATQTWAPQIERFTSAPVVLVAAKTDLIPAWPVSVERASGKAMAERRRWGFSATSAVLNEGVAALFEQQLLQHAKPAPPVAAAAAAARSVRLGQPVHRGCPCA